MKSVSIDIEDTHIGQNGSTLVAQHSIDTEIRSNSHPKPPFLKAQTVPMNMGSTIHKPMSTFREDGKIKVRLQPDGRCPSCRKGNLQEDFPPKAILVALIFFPFGLICCIQMKRIKCDSCDFHLTP